MAEATTDPVARSPIAPAGPVGVVDGWEVSLRRSAAPLRLIDLTPLAKVLVRAELPFLDVAFGRSRRDEDRLVIGTGPGEWTLVGPVGTAADLMASVPVTTTGASALVSVLDVTHGRALVQLSGTATPSLLGKVCAIDLSDRVTPNGAAFRSSVAKLVTDVVRHDLADGTRSYLLHCERSSGQYLFDSLLDAGAEHGIEVDGWPATGG